MLTIAELIAAAKAGAALPSNYRLARALDVPEKTLSRWNAGHNLPDDENAAKLAHLAGIDPGVVVASIRAQRADKPEVRALWAGIAARLANSTAVAGAVILSALFSASPDASAMARTPADGASMAHRLYIMSTRVFAYLARLVQPGPAFRTV